MVQKENYNFFKGAISGITLRTLALVLLNLQYLLAYGLIVIILQLEEEARSADVHALPDPGIGKGISFQPLLDASAQDRDRSRPVSDGATDQNLVPEPTHEVEKRKQGQDRVRHHHGAGGSRAGAPPGQTADDFAGGGGQRCIIVTEDYKSNSKALYEVHKWNSDPHGFFLMEQQHLRTEREGGRKTKMRYEKRIFQLQIFQPSLLWNKEPSGKAGGCKELLGASPAGIQAPPLPPVKKGTSFQQEGSRHPLETLSGIRKRHIKSAQCAARQLSHFFSHSIPY
ncbi:hypothetical protein CDAR_289751 [Caerostris darwini]|uniref:Uncharacterized protein n=1 Tax=Caerostris darwini TaxID=1538125 RepID=A0AAV4WVJ6_9ARAC|nr:hypothetical protein CDAR_289751 [Caerostris darwini]